MLLLTMLPYYLFTVLSSSLVSFLLLLLILVAINGYMFTQSTDPSKPHLRPFSALPPNVLFHFLLSAQTFRGLLDLLFWSISYFRCFCVKIQLSYHCHHHYHCCCRFYIIISITSTNSFSYFLFLFTK